jgi:hypothetical protein
MVRQVTACELPEIYKIKSILKNLSNYEKKQIMFITIHCANCDADDIDSGITAQFETETGSLVQVSLPLAHPTSVRITAHTSNSSLR